MSTSRLAYHGRGSYPARSTVGKCAAALRSEVRMILPSVSSALTVPCQSRSATEGGPILIGCGVLQDLRTPEARTRVPASINTLRGLARRIGVSNARGQR